MGQSTHPLFVYVVAFLAQYRQLVRSAPSGARSIVQVGRERRGLSVVKKSTTSATLRNNIGMEFILIPAGTFRMGSDNGPSNEQPAHQVRISRAFYLGKYEVTQRQWKAVMGNNPSRFKGDDRPVERVRRAA